MKSTNFRNRYLINSVLRACNILRCFSKDKAHFKISELAYQLQLDRSTTYRILLSLEKCGLVEKDGKTGEYSLGVVAFEIGNAYLRKTDLLSIARPIMIDLASRVQETVHLAVLSGHQIIYLDKIDTPRSLGMISKIGKTAPLYCTGVGKILLAYQPYDKMIDILKNIKLTPYTKNTITSKKKLIRELKKVRKRGYALDNGEHEEEIRCIAAPVVDHLGDILAGLSISGPAQRMKDPLLKKEMIKEVINAAHLISSKMGYLRGLKGKETV